MRFWREMSPSTREKLQRAIAGGNENIFSLIRVAMGSQDAQLKSAIREINSIVITGGNGVKSTIGDIFAAIEAGKTTYAKLSSDAKDQIRQEISNLISDSASAVQKQELVALVGTDVANQILATGVVDPTAKTFNKGALKKILEGIKAAPKGRPEELRRLR